MLGGGNGIWIVLLPGGAGAGAGAGAVFPGRFFDGAVWAGVSSNTLAPRPAFRVARIESESDVIMKITADTVVALESSVAEPRGPKAV